MATGVANETVGKLIASSSTEIKYLKFILAFLLKNKKAYAYQLVSKLGLRLVYMKALNTGGIQAEYRRNTGGNTGGNRDIKKPQPRLRLYMLVAI